MKNNPASAPGPGPGAVVRRDPDAMLLRALEQWGGRSDLWLFAYASLIWRPEFEFSEQRGARVHGYHRALKMWSRVNRGTPECPGLVFALLPGGSCKGVVYRVPRKQAPDTLRTLWHREMPNGVYDPKWLACQTGQGAVSALAFTLPKSSPNYTGPLEESQLRQVFSMSCGRYGTTRDYAQQTFKCLCQVGIHDHELERVLRLAGAH